MSSRPLRQAQGKLREGFDLQKQVTRSPSTVGSGPNGRAKDLSAGQRRSLFGTMLCIGFPPEFIPSEVEGLEMTFSISRKSANGKKPGGKGELQARLPGTPGKVAIEIALSL